MSQHFAGHTYGCPACVTRAEIRSPRDKLWGVSVGVQHLLKDTCVIIGRIFFL